MQNATKRTRTPIAHGAAGAAGSFVFALAAALAFAGCGDDPVSSTRLTPAIVSATAPDSLGPGRALDVKVHWRSNNTCQELEGFDFFAQDDTTFTIRAVVIERRDSNTACGDESRIVDGNFRITDPPQKRFHLTVIGATERFDLTIEGGAAAATLERHRVFVRNAVGGAPVDGATAHVVSLASGDTLATITTDAEGIGEAAIACAGDRPYLLEVTGASGRMASLLFRDRPAICGVPESSHIRL